MAATVDGLFFVLLVVSLSLCPERAGGEGLQRQKRDWITAPRPLHENHDYRGLESIARIRSDKENFTKITYSLRGPGVDQPPVGTFGINPSNGYVRIYTILDREQIPFYHLKGMARYMDGTYAEKDIDLIIKVVDENDCAPVIKAQQVGSVSESSAAGAVVMKVIATDDDEANTRFSQISYGIAEQSNVGGMFFMNSQTGEVTVRQSTLDRETQDTYRLIVTASDLNGESGGNTGSGEVEIKILDINDNFPTLERESYEGSVEENTVNVEVMRIKAIDMDLMHSDNWLAVFEIISGNEGGYFTITTDTKTNEGIIMVHKALDYEEIKALNLQVVVSNKAKYNFGSTTATGPTAPRPYPVKINVVNQKEGPRFHPTVKVVTISEDHSSVSLHKVITNYAAIDSDTSLTATNVRYAKIRDSDNWLIIDEKTADIKLNKLPDRESKFLINGTYYAEIICITTDVPTKTATGTIAIQVEDFNDHCPELTTTTHTMCFEDNVIYATAVDKDELPNSTPFEFTVIAASSSGEWTVEHLNETTAVLREQTNLWPGTYKVAVEVKDQQGKSCADVQVMDVTVCTCLEDTKVCSGRSTKTVSLGASGILLLLLGLLLLLLVPLLLMFCLCGGVSGDFKPIPFDTKQQLISYHTEGQGEDKELPLLHVPVGGGTLDAKDVHGGKGFLDGLAEGEAVGAARGGGHSSTLTHENIYKHYNQSGGQVQVDYVDGHMSQDHLYSKYRTGAFDGMSLSEQFLGEYYSSKSNHAAVQSQPKDALLVYDYEGQESLAGSVGCCSLLENEDDLAFLDDLGPKFKTLAEICSGSTFVAESVAAGVSVVAPRPVSPSRPSTHTHVHTHTETVRDRDQVNVTNVNTSNVSSGLSTVTRAQESARVHVQDNVVVPTQTLLIQQPAMYYAATPMYVMESQPQMVLVAGGTQQAVGQVGLNQGLVQVGGLQASQGLVLVDSQVGMGSAVGMGGAVGMGSAVGMGGAVGIGSAVGMGGAVGIGSAVGQAAQGVTQGSISRSRQVLVVENGSSGGGQGAPTAQMFVQRGEGATEQGLEVRGQSVRGMSYSLGSHGSIGSNEDITLTATPKLQGSQKVVVQHKKVSVTERNVESSSRA